MYVSRAAYGYRKLGKQLHVKGGGSQSIQSRAHRRHFSQIACAMCSAVPAVKTQKMTHFKQTLQVFHTVNKGSTANFTLGNNKVEAFDWISAFVVNNYFPIFFLKFSSVLLKKKKNSFSFSFLPFATKPKQMLVCDALDCTYYGVCLCRHMSPCLNCDLFYIHIYGMQECVDVALCF